MSWEWRKHDRTKVLNCLQQGEYEAITTSGQGALDKLAHLATELGVLEAAGEMEVKRVREGIPDELLLRTSAVLPFIEAKGLKPASQALFADPAILLQLGYTALHIQNGFNERRGPEQEEKSAQALPCHPEVLRQELSRLKPESVADFRQRCIQELFARDLVQGDVYALDGSGLRDRQRLVGVLNVTAERPLWVNWRVLPGEASEKGKDAWVVKEMVEEIEACAGAGAIGLLLMDALYADGPLLAWLKYERGIDALVRLPEERTLYRELWSLVRHNPQVQESHLDVRYVAGRKQTREVTLGTMGHLNGWKSFREAAAKRDAREAKLWGCTIQTIDQEDPTEVEQWALVSTRSFATGEEAFSQWRKRWRVENSGFRELKEGWHLERAPWSYSDQRVVQARVGFTCVAFNVAQVAKTAQGRHLTERGIRRLRRELAQEYGPAPVVVFADGAYGVFHIEEIVEALGLPPPEFSLRNS